MERRFPQSPTPKGLSRNGFVTLPLAEARGFSVSGRATCRVSAGTTGNRDPQILWSRCSPPRRFYPLADCPAERREHSVVQVLTWPLRPQAGSSPAQQEGVSHRCVSRARAQPFAGHPGFHSSAGKLGRRSAVRRNFRRVSPHASRDEVIRRSAVVRRYGDRAYLLVQGLRDLVTVAITEQPTRAYSLYVSRQ